MTAGIVRSKETLSPSQVSDGVRRYEIVPSGPYAEALFAHHYSVESGKSFSLQEESFDLYFYVLEGEGSAKVNDLEVELMEGVALFTLPNEVVEISASTQLEIVTIYLPAPGTPWADHLARPIDLNKRVRATRLGAASHQAATGSRQFEVLFDAKNGSRGATLFVGFIPSSGAPQHYHLYDEICVVARGHGSLVTSDGQEQVLEKGSAFHVAPRFLHALHNPNPEDLWILGLFRPEGSAAAAFYPDGRPAPVEPDN
jgi:quercetin dioxygenase-like cupin family protein